MRIASLEFIVHSLFRLEDRTGHHVNYSKLTTTQLFIHSFIHSLLIHCSDWRTAPDRTGQQVTWKPIGTSTTTVNNNNNNKPATSSQLSNHQYSPSTPNKGWYRLYFFAVRNCEAMTTFCMMDAKYKFSTGLWIPGLTYLPYQIVILWHFNI